jgi:histone H3/H4
MVDLIKKNNLKEAVSDLQIAEDVAETLNAKVLKILDEAANRAKLNGRRTLLSRDL